MTRIATLAILLVSLTAVAARGDSPVADAAERNDASRVSSLLQKRADVNATQIDGMTALHWAAYHDHLKLAQLLIENGADASCANRYGVRPLSLACSNGNGALVEALLKAGADANTTRQGRETALMTAARTGKLKPVQLLLDHKAKVDAQEHNGQTALMWAAAEGHLDVVKLLLAHKADFRATLPSGFTPLFFAVRAGHIEVTDALLRAGIDVNDVMKPKQAGGKRPRGGTSALLLAVENGHFELAWRLLEAGADPNDQRSGFTPLHAITWVRKPNRGDGPDGDPPPEGSGNLSSLQFVRKLVAGGAKVNAQLKRGKGGRGRLHRKDATPFLLAAKTADGPLLRLLLELGADASIPNVDRATPLMAAAGLGTIAPREEAGTEDEALEVVKLLLKLGADVNAVDKNGETAMHGAAYKSFPKMVQLLADRDANIAVWNRKNRYGWTPLLIAEGHRPGNFKPSFETIKAIHRVMLAAGVKPPPRTLRRKPRKGYEKR